jgi:3-hydroxyanthranilate 3,4-dioxygenase
VELRSEAIELERWIRDNIERFGPTTGTQTVWADREMLVMIIRGPNSRLDFHRDPGDEFFYQLRGDIELHLMPSGEKRKVVAILEGELFVCPGGVPHSPRRGPDTFGLVIERRRLSGEADEFLWFCEQCDSLVHQASAGAEEDAAGRSRDIQSAFNDSEELRTCKQCGYRYPTAPVAQRLSFLSSLRAQDS